MFLTVLHVLCDDVDGLCRYHGEEAHQASMLQGLHEIGLRQEGLDGHGARFQALDGHLPVVVVHTWVPWENTTTQFIYSFELFESSL